MEKLTFGAEGEAPDERWDLARYALSFVNERSATPRLAAARCYGFSVSNWHFLLEEGQAAELISQPVHTPLPNSPDHCLGLANVRGNILPYYSLHYFFPESAAFTGEPSRYALLLGDPVTGILLAVDTKPQAVARDSLVQRPHVTSRLPEYLAPFIKHQYVAEGKDWMMLDSAGLIPFLASFDPE